MRALWISNIINIILNPCLILGLGPFPQLGLTGSAIGTTIGRGSGVLFQLWILFGGMARVKLSLSTMRVNLPVMTRLFRVSLNGMFQVLVGMTSWLGLVRITASFGSSALAGYLIAIRIIMFIILPAWGLCNAAATLVGQSLGAGKPERAEQAVYRAGFYNMAFMGTVAVIFIIFAESFLGVFSREPEVLRYGASCLRTISYGYCFYAWGMVTLQAFNGAGDTWTPTLINLGCLWALQLPLGYILAIQAGMGAQGVFTAIPIAQSTLALVGLWNFRRGKWKGKKI
jgi:putative MATE family efflux protein